MEEKKVYVDPINTSFAKAMEITTYAGLGIMIIFGLLYVFGLPGLVNMKVAISHWHLSAHDFWKTVKGTQIQGYAWFLSHITKMDCIAVTGMCIMALAPFAGLIASLIRSKGDKLFTLFFIILILEFAFAILKPIIMPNIGGH